MKNVLDLGFTYESILKIQYYGKFICLYQTIYYGKIGTDKA